MASLDKPNIVFIMADDLGWGNVGFHNDEDPMINTPNMDSLATTGLQLGRHYSYCGCTPSRSSFQSGRLPVHVTMLNNDGLDVPTHGVPAEMTSIASKLKEADYHTYLVGKWDCGFASHDQIPSHKGYDYFYGYLSKANGYFDKMGMDICQDDVDLWEMDAPAHDKVSSMDQEEFVEFAFRFDVCHKHVCLAVQYRSFNVSSKTDAINFVYEKKSGGGRQTQQRGYIGSDANL